MRSVAGWLRRVGRLAGFPRLRSRRSLRFSPTRGPIKPGRPLSHGLLPPIHPVLPVFIRRRSIRFPGVRRGLAPTPWTPRPDRPLSGPAESPETSGDSPPSGEGREETWAASRYCQNPRELPTGRSPPMSLSVSMARLSCRSAIIFRPAGDGPPPMGGRQKQKPKAPRLPHVFGLPALGAFHLGGASASSRPAGGPPDSLVRRLGLPPHPSDKGNGPIGILWVIGDLLGMGFSLPFTSHEVPGHLFVPTHVRT